MIYYIWKNNRNNCYERQWKQNRRRVIRTITRKRLPKHTVELNETTRNKEKIRIWKSEYLILIWLTFAAAAIRYHSSHNYGMKNRRETKYTPLSLIRLACTCALSERRRTRRFNDNANETRFNCGLVTIQRVCI